MADAAPHIFLVHTGVPYRPRAAGMAPSGLPCRPVPVSFGSLRASLDCGDHPVRWRQEANAAEVALLREVLDEEAFAAAWAEGRAMALEKAVAYALDEPPSA